MLLNSLLKFYSDKANFDRFNLFRDNKESGISIRMWDSYVTEYTKKYNEMIQGSNKSVHDSYKEQLKGFGKRMCDPNARNHSGKKLEDIENYDDAILAVCSIPIPGIGTIDQTNVGQLNFFRWGILKKIYLNIKNNENKIRAFIKTEQERKKLYKKKKKARRHRSSSKNSHGSNRSNRSHRKRSRSRSRSSSKKRK